MRNYLIYPTLPITEQDMLEIVHSSYEDLDEEELKKVSPKENEIQYDEAKEISTRLVNEFRAADSKPSGIYMMYMVESMIGEAYWNTYFTFPDGYDFSISFSTLGGKLLNWQSYVHGVLPFTYDTLEANSWTDDDVFVLTNNDQ